MNRPLPCCAASGWLFAKALQRFNLAEVFFLALVFSAAVARGQTSWTEARAVYGVSGQFVVTAVPQPSPLQNRADIAADENLVRLEPALLAVSAERFKLVLWSQLGLKPTSQWVGKVFLTIRPAQSVNDPVDININYLANAWSYRVELPDVVARTRYARALTGVLLLEIANRDNYNGSHSAELPPWLTDGLARQVLGVDPTKIVLSSPSKKTDGLVQSRVNSKESGIDPLVGARRVLQESPALTFDQLSWPTDAQMNGDDGGIYLASAQLFVSSLLTLDHGADKLRAMLAQLPACMNWQTAFFAAFRQNFKRPLDVEKWWSLRVVHFAGRDPGPHWTTVASRERLEDLLAVPVEFRDDEHSLPRHTVVSLQDAIQNFEPAQYTAILEIKRRDFELAQFRMTQPFAALADGYRTVITDFLGGNKKTTSRVTLAGKRSVPMRRPADVTDTVKKLDALDARRREVEAKMDANPLPKH